MRPLIVKLFLTTMYLILKSQLKNQPEFFVSTSVTFGNDVYIAKTMHTKVESNYTRFKGFEENDTYLFLKLNKIKAIAFPKELFSPIQIEFIKTKITEANQIT